jgi:hypothetical protein
MRIEPSGPWNSMEPVVTAPRSGPRMPEMAFSVVLFPAPFEPRSATMPPCGTSKETPRRTRIDRS